MIYGPERQEQEWRYWDNLQRAACTILNELPQGSFREYGASFPLLDVINSLPLMAEGGLKTEDVTGRPDREDLHEKLSLNARIHLYAPQTSVLMKIF